MLRTRSGGRRSGARRREPCRGSRQGVDRRGLHPWRGWPTVRDLRSCFRVRAGLPGPAAGGRIALRGSPSEPGSADRARRFPHRDDHPAFAQLIRTKAPLGKNQTQSSAPPILMHDAIREQSPISLLLLPLVVEAEVVGQIQPGIPVWKPGTESKFPNCTYVVFPGNVGEIDSLKKVYEILTQ